MFCPYANSETSSVTSSSNWSYISSTTTNSTWSHNPYSTNTSASSRPQQGPPKHTDRRKATICLDYLHGECAQKRLVCSYFHPDVTNWPRGVCWAYYATGFCKYGVQCELEHPTEYAGVAEIAITRGMTFDQRQRGMQAMQVQQQQQSAHQQGPPTLSMEQRLRKTVEGWCRSHCEDSRAHFEHVLNDQPQNHDLLATALIDILASTHSKKFCEALPGLLLQHLLSPNFDQFCETLLVAICGKLSKGIKEGAGGLAMVELLEFLWQLYKSGCGNQGAHLCALKVMCGSNLGMIVKLQSMVEQMYKLGLVNVEPVSHNKPASFGVPTFTDWSNLFLNVKEGIITKMLAEEHPPPSPPPALSITLTGATVVVSSASNTPSSSATPSEVGTIEEDVMVDGDSSDDGAK